MLMLIATEKLLVEFDNTQIDVERIKQAIIEAGLMCRTGGFVFVK